MFCFEDNLKKADPSDKKYESFTFILFLLVKKAQRLELESDQGKETTEEPATLTEQEMADIQRFGWIATKMYAVVSSGSAAAQLCVCPELDTRPDITFQPDNK